MKSGSTILMMRSIYTALEPYVLLTKVSVANNVVGADEVGKHNLDDAIDIHITVSTES